jgi:hypothetical protein
MPSAIVRRGPGALTGGLLRLIPLHQPVKKVLIKGGNGRRQEARKSSFLPSLTKTEMMGIEHKQTFLFAAKISHCCILLKSSPLCEVFKFLAVGWHVCCLTFDWTRLLLDS